MSVIAMNAQCTHVRILVVDDDPMQRILLRAALEQAGFGVLDLPDAGRLNAECEDSHPDLILLDVMMPGIDGFQACRALQSSEACRHVPVVMMTGLDDEASIDKAYQAGATDFITKPVNFSLIRHRLRFVLRAKHDADALRASEARLEAAQRIARVGHWEADSAGRLMHWNAHTHRLLGLSMDRQVDDLQALLERADPHHRDSLGGRFRDALNGGSGFSTEFCLLGDDGHRREIAMEWAVVTLPDGTRQLSGTVQDVTARRRAERRIHQLTFFDEITGLPNGLALRRDLVAAVATAARHGRKLAVLSLDLDRFQRINDTLGFDAGNGVLRTAAERIHGVVRASDPLARSGDPGGEVDSMISRGGGDEFTVVLTDLQSEEQAGRVARRLQDALAQPMLVGDQEIFLQASIGISLYPADGQEAEPLIRNADAARAHAKREGRNCFRFFAPALNDRTARRLALEAQLRRAIEQEQFVLHYQPKVRSGDQAVCGMEALVRWDHPDEGRISPAEFIPLAEETGLIVPLGDWIIERACRDLATLHGQGLVGLSCAVNISAVQFRERDLPRRLGRLAAAAGVPATSMDLEITESMLMEDGVGTLLRELAEQGFRLAIDDFGTGYSSLSYLKRLPIHTVKIDQVFVRDLPGDRDDASIVGAIVAMARRLGLRTVAEGVETWDQARLLHTLGCDVLQGYLFSKPLPLDEFSAYVHVSSSSPMAETRAATAETVRAGSGLGLTPGARLRRNRGSVSE